MILYNSWKQINSFPKLFFEFLYAWKVFLWKIVVQKEVFTVLNSTNDHLNGEHSRFCDLLETMLARCNRFLLPAAAAWLYVLIFMLGAVLSVQKLSKRFVCGFDWFVYWSLHPNIFHNIDYQLYVSAAFSVFFAKNVLWRTLVWGLRLWQAYTYMVQLMQRFIACWSKMVSEGLERPESCFLIIYICCVDHNQRQLCFVWPISLSWQADWHASYTDMLRSVSFSR